MKKLILMSFVVPTVLFSPQIALSDSNLSCMPHALRYAVDSFEKAKVRGIVAQGIGNLEGEIDLGTELSVGTVEIDDIHKNSYRVRFNLRYVKDKTSSLVLDTTIYDFDYALCSIREESLSQLENPHYRVFERRP